VAKVVQFRVTYTPSGNLAPIASIKSQLSWSKWDELQDDDATDARNQFCAHIRNRLASEKGIELPGQLDFSSLSFTRIGARHSPVSL